MSTNNYPQMNSTPNNLENAINTVHKYLDRANEILHKYEIAPNGFSGDKFYTHKDEPSAVPLGYIQIVECYDEGGEITFPINWLFTDDDQLEEKVRAYKAELAEIREKERQKLAEEKAKANEKAELAQLAYLKAKYPDA
jgi:hypothetical protein